MSDELERRPTPEGKVEALRKVDERWDALLLTLDGIPSARVTEPITGEWSVKDLVAHIAFWDGQAEIAAQREALGESSSAIDWRAMNEREAAASKGRPFDDVWRELNETHKRMRFVLQQLPTLDVKAVGEDTFDHYEEHRSEIQAWRERTGI